MLSSNMLLPNLIPLIDVTFSTPTGDYAHHRGLRGEAFCHFSALYERKSSAISVKPKSSSACQSGVVPIQRTLGLAPALRRSSATSRYPPYTAQCRGVMPPLSTALGL